MADAANTFETLAIMNVVSISTRGDLDEAAILPYLLGYPCETKKRQ